MARGRRSTLLASEELLTTAEAARMLGLTPATVRYLETMGHLAARRTATGVRLFTRQDVEALRQLRRQRRRRRTPAQQRRAETGTVTVG